MMRQYHAIKRENPDSLLLYRMGDFYETFGDDAVIVAKDLGIALTARDKNSENPIPLAGVPYHALDNYLSKLIMIPMQAARAQISCEIEPTAYSHHYNPYNYLV